MVHVGTSGWSYRHWRGPFYPAQENSSRWLSLYAQHFKTVEINSTFYRLAKESTLQSWYDSVPDDFVFAIKASRYLTHVKRLRDPGPPVALLLERTAALGEKRGPVLLQLPPDGRASPDLLDAALEAFGSEVRVAVELRHRSWESDAVREVLERRGAALCLTDRKGPGRPQWKTADWGYVRFHAGQATPEPCYGRVALRSWASRLSTLWPPTADIYAYFNNDQVACAPRNAREFLRVCARPGTDAVPAAVGGSRAGIRLPADRGEGGTIP